MRFIKLLLFSLVILSTLFGQVCVLLVFEANKLYIAKNLCENKKRLAMHCNGKCKLGKKLAQENDHQKAFTLGKADVLYFDSHVFLIHKNTVASGHATLHSLYKNPFINKVLSRDILRPPRINNYKFTG